MDGLGPPPNVRGGHAGRPGHQRLCGDGRAALIGLDQFADELQQAHAFVGGVADLGGVGEIAQDVAAALGLAQEEVGVLAQRPLGRLAGELLGDDGDGGQGRCRAHGPPPPPGAPSADMRCSRARTVSVTCRASCILAASVAAR